MATNAKQFNLICEAFEVLSDHKYKAIYDAYGETVLKNNFSYEDNGDNKGVQYRWKNNANGKFSRFEEVFETSHPFLDEYSLVSNNLGGSDLQGSML